MVPMTEDEIPKCDARDNNSGVASRARRCWVIGVADAAQGRRIKQADEMTYRSHGNVRCPRRALGQAVKVGMDVGAMQREVAMREGEARRFAGGRRNRAPLYRFESVRD
jgi:hypothetical protein